MIRQPGLFAESPPDPSLATVTSVRGKDRDALLSDPRFLYIGRPMFRGNAPGWKGSVYANPFRVGMGRNAAISILRRDIDNETRNETLDIRLCLIFYRSWLMERSGLAHRIPELRGRTLGCWCGEWSPGQHPIPCHGWILATAANKEAEGKSA